jgi:hypothetical protein
MGPVLPRFSLRELPKPILTSTVVSNFSLACPLDNRLQFNAASDYFQQKLLSITEEGVTAWVKLLSGKERLLVLHLGQRLYHQGVKGRHLGAILRASSRIRRQIPGAIFDGAVTQWPRDGYEKCLSALRSPALDQDPD